MTVYLKEVRTFFFSYFMRTHPQQTFATLSTYMKEFLPLHVSCSLFLQLCRNLTLCMQRNKYRTVPVQVKPAVFKL